jgi:hypothetical protein
MKKYFDKKLDEKFARIVSERIKAGGDIPYSTSYDSPEGLRLVYRDVLIERWEEWVEVNMEQALTMFEDFVSLCEVLETAVDLYDFGLCNQETQKVFNELNGMGVSQLLRLWQDYNFLYNVQSYLVKFDMGNPVDVNINVYRENETKLLRHEIIDEALGYAKEIGLELDEKYLFEIEELEMKR